MTSPTKKAQQAPAQEFEITGGNLVLDFANTLSKRRSEHKEEQLLGYSDLIRWAMQAGVISSTEANRIFRWAEKHSKQATKVLQNAINLRESVYQIFSAIASHQEPNAPDMQILSQAMSSFSSKTELAWTSNKATWQWVDEEDNLEKIVWQVMQSCVDLLISDQLNRVRECEAGSCGWLFIDHSKNGSRRWCDMKVCGNREKAKRFYERIASHAV
jgi:predicted RNA-binding Zn ribbon-like protein